MNVQVSEDSDIEERWGSSLPLTLGGFLSDGLDFTGFVHILEKRFSIKQL